jgi:hypothetical protein
MSTGIGSSLRRFKDFCDKLRATPAIATGPYPLEYYPQGPTLHFPQKH